MSTRLQVVVSERELGEIREAADAARTTVSEWVRQALREARALQPDERGGSGAGVVREARPPHGDLLAQVMARYGLVDADAAVRFALERAVYPPLDRAGMLAMEGSGWEGDLDVLRGAERPEAVL